MIQTHQEYHSFDILNSCRQQKPQDEIHLQSLNDIPVIREVLLFDEENITSSYAMTIENKELSSNADLIKNKTEIYFTNIAAWLRLAFTKNKTIKIKVSEILFKNGEGNFEYIVLNEIYIPSIQNIQTKDIKEEQLNIALQTLKIFGYKNEPTFMSLREEEVSSHDSSTCVAFISGIKNKIDIILREVAPLMLLDKIF